MNDVSPAVNNPDQSKQGKQNNVNQSGDRTDYLKVQSANRKDNINQSDNAFQNPLSESGLPNQHLCNNSGYDTHRESRSAESNHSNRSSRQSSPKPDYCDLDQGQSQRFKNRVLPQYGDLDSLVPPHQYSGFPPGCFSQETRTDQQDSKCSDYSTGYSNFSDNSRHNCDNQRDNPNNRKDIFDNGKGACNIDSEGANCSIKNLNCYEDLQINGADNFSDSDTWSQNTPVQILRRESSTISDFTTLTDTSPLVKLEMKRMSTGSIKGYENPTFESSGHFELKDFKEDGLLEPTPVKRYRSDSQRSQCSIQNSNDHLNNSMEQQLRLV